MLNVSFFPTECIYVFYMILRVNSRQTVLFARNLYFVSILFLKVYTYTECKVVCLRLKGLLARPGILRQWPEYLSINHRSHLSVLRWMWSMVDTQQHYAVGRYLSATLLNFLQSVRTWWMHRIMRWEWHFYRVH